MLEKTAPRSSSIEKICHDSECAERISSLKPEFANVFKTFTYCPFCAEELMLVCQSCKEQLNSNEYKFCPWCGAKFVDSDPK
jgi:predicted RNA-binding Zn-ribbon protein involved in translation (DUF1610 family)